MVKPAHKCLEWHGMRVKLPAEKAELLMDECIAVIRSEITGFDTAELIQPQRALCTDAGKAVRLDKGRKIGAQVRISTWLHR